MFVGIFTERSVLVYVPNISIDVVYFSMTDTRQICELWW